MGTAYFGHALLAELLLPKLKASAPARIVWMSGALEAQANLRWDDLGCAWGAAAAGSRVLYGVQGFGFRQLVRDAGQQAQADT